MELKSIAVGVVATLLLLSAVGAGAFAATGGLSDRQAASPQDSTTATPTTTETQETVNEDDVNEQARASIDGAHALKTELENSEYDDSRVFIQKDGTVTVYHNSSAQDGNTLKEEVTDIAYLYSTVMAEHNETGSLTVYANGVTLMVSPDAAAAHGNGELKDDAFEKTFHWTTSSKETDN